MVQSNGGDDDNGKTRDNDKNEAQTIDEQSAEQEDSAENYGNAAQKPSSQDPFTGRDNVIKIPSLTERDKARKQREKEEKKAQKQREALEEDYRRQYKARSGGTGAAGSSAAGATGSEESGGVRFHDPDNPHHASRYANQAQFAAHGKCTGRHKPVINLPPVTKYALLIMLAIHIGVHYALSPVQQYWVYSHFGFVPADYTDGQALSLYAILGPFTYMFLHGNWMHIILNGAMVMAFGAGIERWMGGRKMLVFFLLCSLSAALVQFAVTPHSDNPVIGASGGLSGLFAAVMVMIQQSGRLPPSRFGVWPLVLVWIGISFVFGMFGAPDGSPIAWVAHIGGFIAGFIFLKPVMRMKI